MLDKDGKALALTDKGGGRYTFTMPAGEITVKAVFMDDNTMLNFFTDVSAEDYYYDAVLWAAQEGVTGGTSDTLFAPNAGCTRAQAVTFCGVRQLARAENAEQLCRCPSGRLLREGSRVGGRKRRREGRERDRIRSRHQLHPCAESSPSCGARSSPRHPAAKTRSLTFPRLRTTIMQCSGRSKTMLRKA